MLCKCTTNINTFNTIRTLITYQVLKLSECLFVEQHNRSCNSSKHDSSSQRNERNINCTLTDSVMEAPSVVLCEIYTCNYIGPENDYLTCSPGHCVGKLTVSFAVEPAVKFQKSGNKFLPAITDVCLFSFDKPHTHTRLMVLFPGLPRWAGTRNVNQSGFYWSKRQWVAMVSAGPYASLHLAPDR